MRFVEWLISRPADQLGNAMYIIVFIWVGFCVLLAHWRGKIDLWELVTATDRHGEVRTDAAKFWIAGAFVVTSVTFLYLAVLRMLTEWYVLIFLVAWLGERFRRDLMQLRQIATLGPTDQQKKGG